MKSIVLNVDLKKNSRVAHEYMNRPEYLEVRNVRVRSRPRPFFPNHALSQKGPNSNNETRFGSFELCSGA